MNDFPEKTCEIDRLIRQPALVAAALKGQKTQQRRNGLYAYPGEVFTLEGVEFEICSVERRKIGEMTDQDAQAEGFPSLATYKDMILKMHASMEWNAEGLVWVHSFNRRQPE
ncbi:MAG: ASCH domain-containing protein [Methylococcales bacterium]|nr:ASCH domain-containing protein [Methylococcales bacterium]